MESHEYKGQQQPIFASENTAKPGCLEPDSIKPRFFYNIHAADTTKSAVKISSLN